MHVVMCLGFFVFLITIGNVFSEAELDMSQLSTHDASYIHHTPSLGLTSTSDTLRERRHIGSLAAANGLRTRLYNSPKANMHRRSGYLDPELSIFQGEEKTLGADLPIPQASRKNEESGESASKRYFVGGEGSPEVVPVMKMVATPSPIRPRFVPPSILNQYQKNNYHVAEVIPRIRNDHPQYWRHMEGLWNTKLHENKSKKYVGALARANAIPNSVVGFHYTRLGKRTNPIAENEDDYDVLNPYLPVAQSSQYKPITPGQGNEMVLDSFLLDESDETDDVLPMALTKRNIASLARLGLLPHTRASRFNVIVYGPYVKINENVEDDYITVSNSTVQEIVKFLARPNASGTYHPAFLSHFRGMSHPCIALPN